MTRTLLTLTALTTLSVSTATPAAVVVTATEVGGDVVITGSGTLDTSLWTPVGLTNNTPVLAPARVIGVGSIGDPADTYVLPVNFTGPANIGSGRSGRLRNSGWAWVPTKNGCTSCGSSTTCMIGWSGAWPEKIRPPAAS